jgi:hypothetical protein
MHHPMSDFHRILQEQVIAVAEAHDHEVDYLRHFVLHLQFENSGLKKCLSDLQHGGKDQIPYGGSVENAKDESSSTEVQVINMEEAIDNEDQEATAIPHNGTPAAVGIQRKEMRGKTMSMPRPENDVEPHHFLDDFVKSCMEKYYIGREVEVLRSSGLWMPGTVVKSQRYGTIRVSIDNDESFKELSRDILATHIKLPGEELSHSQLLQVFPAPPPLEPPTIHGWNADDFAVAVGGPPGIKRQTLAWNMQEPSALSRRVSSVPTEQQDSRQPPVQTAQEKSVPVRCFRSGSGSSASEDSQSSGPIISPTSARSLCRSPTVPNTAGINTDDEFSDGEEPDSPYSPVLSEPWSSHRAGNTVPRLSCPGPASPSDAISRQRSDSGLRKKQSEVFAKDRSSGQRLSLQVPMRSETRRPSAGAKRDSAANRRSSLDSINSERRGSRRESQVSFYSSASASQSKRPSIINLGSPRPSINNLGNVSQSLAPFAGSPRPSINNLGNVSQSFAAFAGASCNGNDNENGCASCMADDSDSSSNAVEFTLLPIWITERVTRRRGKVLDGMGTFQTGSLAGSIAIPQHGRDDEMFEKIVGKPSSAFHILWTACCLALIIKDAVLVPLEVFELMDMDPTGPLSLVSLCFWMLDVANSFRTGYITSEGVLEMRISKVTRRYIKTWMALDLSWVMCDWVVLFRRWLFDPGKDIDALAKVARSLVMLRLMRVPKVTRLAGFLSEHIRSEMTNVIVGIAKIVVFLIWMAHLVACAWYAIGVRMGSATIGPDTWVAKNGLERESMATRYVWSLHWSLAQFVGENLFEIHSVAEHVFATLILFLAFIFSALFVSSITTAMTKISVITSTLAGQNLQLRRYLADNGISNSLSMRVRRNAQHAVDERKKQAPEESIELLQLVSEPLRVELHFELRGPFLLSHPFFENYEEVNPAGLRELCHSALLPEKASHGDIMFSNGETPTRPRMYFVTGSVVFHYHRHDNGDPTDKESGVQILNAGTWVGEPVLWTSWTHQGQLRVKDDCTILVLDAEQFQKIVSPYPTPHANNYGEAFVDALNNAGVENLTDTAFPEREMQNVLAHAFPDRYRLQQPRNSGLDSIVSGNTYTNPSGAFGVWDSVFGTSHSLLRSAKTRTFDD